MRTYVLAVAALVFVVGATVAAEHTTDSLATTKKNVADGKATLVDVREASEWNAGHLQEARHISLSDLKKGISAETLKQLLPPGSVVYLHCASGKRCLAAADLLKKYGYDVRPLKDGYKNLLNAGFTPAK